MKIILSQPELEQIVSNHLATIGIDTTDKEVEYVFLEGAEIEIGTVSDKNKNTTKPKRQTKAKKSQAVDDGISSETPDVPEEPIEDVDALFDETENQSDADADALFDEETNNTDDDSDDDDAGMFD